LNELSLLLTATAFNSRDFNAKFLMKQSFLSCYFCKKKGVLVESAMQWTSDGRLSVD